MTSSQDTVVVELNHLQQLFDVLTKTGYTLVGPILREGAIVYDRLTSVTDLPVGWGDVQDGGTYRLLKRDDEVLFGYAVSPQSWKKFLLPSVIRLWQAKRAARGFQALDKFSQGRKYAFVGVRACELHAIAIQDAVFLRGKYIDPLYKTQRDNVFIMAVNCGQAGGTCFCASMRSGPKATFGFDLALTEITEARRHYFVVDVGTEKGAKVIKSILHRKASEAEFKAAARTIATASKQMRRTLNTDGIKSLLYRNYEHPRWDEVADRCLTCGNCTSACPTCFCTTVYEATDLANQRTERWRRWDSCFTMDFTYIHGGSVRATPMSRYRQWITHKLASWIDQFGTSGCVGCGRCITWCPVAIDITEEVRAIRESERNGAVVLAGGKQAVNA